MEGVIMGLKSMTHQFTTIGAYAMIGMGAVVVKDVPPGAKVVGNPARFIGWNTIGFERNNVSKENLDQLKIAWQKFRREGRKKITLNEN
jgi:acyl-[acyl carrier protein]--UDP-N-acetylglucosamine O-acyltransferase